MNSICSEGSVLPLVDKMSSRSRISNFLEIVDIPDKDAKTYLRQSMPEDFAKDLVVLTGGRFVHLLTAVSKYNALIQKQNTVHLTEILFTCTVRSSMVKILEQPEHLRHIEKNIMDSVLPDGCGKIELLALANSMNVDVAVVAKAVLHLVSVNLLRYQYDGSVIFHRLVQWSMKNKLKFGER